jgi:hypothetical protein
MARLSKIQKDALTPEEEVKPEIQPDMYELLQALLVRVEVLETQMVKKSSGPSINKVETFNGEVETPIEGYNGFRMGEADKIQSMRNAIAILPPNMVDKETKRHRGENIQAICGFKVTDEMLDAAYEGLK